MKRIVTLHQLYRSVNSLQDFEFHDSFWSLVDHDASSYVFNAKALNLHQDAPQNPEDCDMEIEDALITFSRCRITEFRSFREEAPKDYGGEQCLKRFLKEANLGIWVKGFDEVEHGQWLLASCGDEEPYYVVRMSFEGATIGWDAFRRPAWYVLNQRGIQA